MIHAFVMMIWMMKVPNCNVMNCIFIKMSCHYVSIVGLRFIFKIFKNSALIFNIVSKSCHMTFDLWVPSSLPYMVFNKYLKTFCYKGERPNKFVLSKQYHLWIVWVSSLRVWTCCRGTSNEWFRDTGITFACHIWFFFHMQMRASFSFKLQSLSMWTKVSPKNLQIVAYNFFT